MMGSPDRARSRSPWRAMDHIESMSGSNAVNDGTRDDKANRDGDMRKLIFICMNGDALDLLASTADTLKDVRDQLLDLLKLEGLSVRLCVLPNDHSVLADDRVVGDVPCQVFRLVILKLVALSCVGPAVEKPKNMVLMGCVLRTERYTSPQAMPARLSASTLQVRWWRCLGQQ